MFGNSGSVDLGSVNGRIIITTNAADAVAQTRRELQNGISGMAYQMQGMGNQVAGIGGQITAMTAPLNLFMAASVRSFASLEDTLVAIRARTASTAEEMAAVEEFVTQKGADTVFSSKQAADALLQLMTAGLTLQQAMNTLPAVLDGAAASQTDLATSADLVTNVMSSFGLGVEDAERIVNQLVKGSGASPATFREMGEALQFAGGVSQQFGLSLEDASAVMAIFAQNGIRGSEASTQLRSLLLNMSRDTADVTTAWSDLGVSMYDAEGAMRPLNDIMKDLDAALDPLTMEEQNRYITTLAGSYGLLGFNALRSSTGIDEMADAIAVQRDATVVAEDTMTSLQNTFNSLQGSIESLQQTALREYVESNLKPTLNAMIAWINQLRTLAEENPEVTHTIVRLLFALGSLGPALFIVGKAIPALGFVLGQLLSPIGLLIGAATALGVAWEHNLFGMTTALKPFVTTVAKGLESVKHVVSAFADHLEQFGLREAILGIFGMGSNGDTVQSSLQGALVMFGMTHKVAEAYVRKLQKYAGEAFKAWDTFTHGFEFAKKAFNTFAADIERAGVRDAIANMFGFGLSGLFDIKSGYLGDLLQAFGMTDKESQALVERLRPVAFALVGMWEQSRASLIQLSDWFSKTGLPASMAFITDVVLPTIQNFGLTILGLVTPFGTLITVGRLLWTAWSQNIGGMRDILPVFVENTINGFTQLKDAVSFFIGDLQKFGVREALMGIFGMGSSDESMQSSLEGVFVAFGMTREAAVGLVESLKPMVAGLMGLWDSSSAGLGALAAWFTETGLPMAMEFIMGTALPALQSLGAWLLGLWTNSMAGLQALSGWFTETGLPAAMTIINGVVIPYLQLLVAHLTGIWTQAQPHLEALGKYFTETTLPAVMEFLNTVVMPALQQFPQWLVSIWEIASPYLFMVSGWFVDILMGAIDLVVNVGLPMFGMFVNFLVSVWELVSPALLALAEWFFVTLGDALTFVDEVVMPLLRGFVDYVVLIWTLASPGLMALQNGFFGVATWIRDNVINPLLGWIQGIVDKINEFLSMINPLQEAASIVENTVSGARDMATAVQQNNIGAGQFMRIVGGAVAGEFGWRDEGGPGVPGGVYAIGRNAGVEAFVTPEVRGDFIANLDKLIAAAAGGAGGGTTFNVTVNANSEDGGRAAARGFHDELVRKGLA